MESIKGNAFLTYIIIGAVSVRPSVWHTILQCKRAPRRHKIEKVYEEYFIVKWDFILKEYPYKIRRTKNKGVFLTSRVDDCKEEDRPYII